MGGRKERGYEGRRKGGKEGVKDRGRKRGRKGGKEGRKDEEEGKRKHRK